MPKISQSELVKQFFQNNPCRNIEHPEVVDWLTAEYKRQTGDIFRDSDRAIRKLHQEGFLIKIAKGIYRYDPKSVKKKNLEDFTQKQKDEILKRDGYKCVMCGKGKKDGAELQVDRMKPKGLGGRATIENGQTLCSQYNFLKKNLKQTETGKKMYIRLYELTKKENNEKLLSFANNILKVYEKHNINGHIEWEK
jgi:5-methylcytosine-specific restriction endonuclease McrA